MKTTDNTQLNEVYIKPPKRFTLRICVFEKNGYFYAECLDWSLIVKRDDPDKAFDELKIQIGMYIESLIELNFPKHLLYRKAPLSSWLNYYWCYVCYHFNNILKHDGHSCMTEYLHPTFTPV